MTTLLVGNRGNIWGGLPVENVARIEIIRGPGSALYGADAFSGVINIITKTAADSPGTQLGARVGSCRSNDAWMLHGGQVGPLDVSAYLRVGKTAGARETVDADQQTRFNRALSLAPGPTNLGHDAIDATLTMSLDKWRFNVGYKERDNVGTGAGIASALDPVGRAGSQRFNADLSWADNQITPDWGGGMTASYLHYAQVISNYFQLFPAGSNSGGGAFGSSGALAAPFTWENQIRLSGFMTYGGFDHHKLRFGLGHDDLDLYKTAEFRNFTYAANGALVPAGGVQDYSSISPFMQPQRRKVDYTYLQDEWQFAKDWTLTAGVRLDHFSDVGTTRNPRLALVWDAAYDLTAKVLYGTAFRAPSFAELYSVTNPVNLGNPRLHPEKIRSLEGAISWQARPDTQINANIYRYRITDLIFAVSNPTAGTGSTYQNTGNRHGSGLELESVWDASRALRLTAHYAQQHSIDMATRTDSGYAPRRHIYGRADWRFAPGWTGSAQVNWVADRKRPFGDSRPDVPDYTALDLTLRADTGKRGMEVAGSIRNLFNARIIEPSLAPGTAIPNDLPQPRRSLYIQVIQSL
jgi:iron complex outermembrane receptor protein